jgi:ribosomal protein L11 methyltransferase
MSREFIRADYLKLDIKFTPLLPAREVAIAWLSELNFEVFESTDQGLTAYIPEQFVGESELLDVKMRLMGLAEVVWSESLVKTRNWNAEWEANYEPVYVGERAIVRAPFHSLPAKTGKDFLDVVIVPHMSFGTGHHDTTLLMMHTLLDMEVKGQTLLDMGCGTGVLAIAALKLGATSVLAIDIEEGAYTNTIENAELNGFSVDESFAVLCGDASNLSGSRLNDIILANINRNILVQDMSSYNNVLRPGGQIALSGFFVGDVPVLQWVIEGLGWRVKEVQDSEGWACIICVKSEQQL